MKTNIKKQNPNSYFLLIMFFDGDPDKKYCRLRIWLAWARISRDRIDIHGDWLLSLKSGSLQLGTQ